LLKWLLRPRVKTVIVDECSKAEIYSTINETLLLNYTAKSSLLRHCLLTTSMRAKSINQAVVFADKLHYIENRERLLLTTNGKFKLFHLVFSLVLVLVLALCFFYHYGDYRCILTYGACNSMALFLTTLSNLQVRSTILHAFSTRFLLHSCKTTDRISTDAERRAVPLRHRSLF